MGYIHAVQLNDNSIHLIEPKLFATASGTSTALTASISNFELAAGIYINLKVGTVDANATLNVNDTGAKPIYYGGTTVNANTLSEGNIYTLIYTGMNWEIVGDISGKNIMIGTTAEWQAHSTYVAPEGTICIYTDASTYTDTNNNVIIIPGIKIGDGINAVVDSPFVGDDIRKSLDDYVNANYAPKDSPTFTGTPKAPTAADGTNNTQIATTEFVYNTLKVADAMIFKGTLSGATSTTYTPAADRGHTYKVANAGLINGERVEVGDILICTNDNTAEATSGNVSTIKSNWVIVQTNLDGAVIGPTSATEGNFALFDGNTGKLLKNSSYSPEDFSSSDHTHILTIAEDTGTNNITLAYGKKYKLTAGGSTYIFTMPASDDTNTHRPIKVNDTQILDDNTIALNLKAGNNVTLTATTNSGDITIEAVDTTYESKAAASEGTAVSLVTTGEKYIWNQKLSAHGPSYGKVTISAQSTATSDLTGLLTAVTIAAKEGNETLKLTTANKWIIATGVSSNTAGADEIKLAHFVPVSITNGGPISNQTPDYGATFDIPKISLDEAGHVTDISAITVKIPASDNTNTATAADNILKASNVDTEITYAPYTTRQPELTFDTATARPTGTDRLNLNGNFHATNLYGDTTVINEQVTLQWNNLDQALEFVFA